MIKKFFAFINTKDLKEMKLKKGIFKNTSNYIHLFCEPYKEKGLKTRKVIVKVLKKKGD